MLRFNRSPHRWWQKPLVEFKGRDLPAELVILGLELRKGENGAWLNSRGTDSGTIDLVRDSTGKFKSVRAPLPERVRLHLERLYSETGLRKGAPDLVVWDSSMSSVRFVEVKCPHWDRPSTEQLEFHRAAKAAGSDVVIVEWEFEPSSPAI